MSEEKQQPPPYIFTPQPAGLTPPPVLRGEIVGSKAAPWIQGIVEIFIRIIVIVFAIAIAIAAVVTFSQITGLNRDLKQGIDNSDDLHITYSEVPSTPNLVKRSRAEYWFLIFLAVLLVTCEIVMALIRCAYFRISSKYIINFHSVDAVVSILLVFLLIGAAIAAAIYATEWNEWVDFLDDYSHHDVIDEEVDTMKAIRDAFAAACAFCFAELSTIGTLIFLLLFAFLLKWTVPSQELQ